jgi:hypothetical protein
VTTLLLLLCFLTVFVYAWQFLDTLGVCSPSFPRIPDVELVDLMWKYAMESSQQQAAAAREKRIFAFGTANVATDQCELPPECHEFVLDRREAAELIVSRCMCFHLDWFFASCVRSVTGCYTAVLGWGVTWAM